MTNKFQHLVSDVDELSEEISSFVTDISLEELGKYRIDLFWNYVEMKVVAMAALSVFCGPVVEGSFSAMKDIMKKKSGKMSCDLLSSIQTVRYFLKGKNTNSLKFFRRTDTALTPVSANLSMNMRKSWKVDKKSWEEARELNDQKFEELRLKKVKLQAAAEARRIREKALYKSNKKQVDGFKKLLLKPKQPSKKRRVM